MDIVNRHVSDLIPYENNPRNNRKAVRLVAESIRQFGFKVPLVIDSQNVVVCGHTRLKACKELGIEEVPCVIADDLTDDQIRAFRLADNKAAEAATWDKEKLNEELEGIQEIDMTAFDMQPIDLDEWHQEQADATQDRVLNVLNLDKGYFETCGEYGMPKLYAQEIPEVKEWIPFHWMLQEKHPEGKGVHFFIDDYKFERVWKEPEKYVEKLSRFAAVIAPDFSMYDEMSLACLIFNAYRRMWCAAYFQQNGCTVVPMMSTCRADRRTLSFFCDGIPSNATVAVSTMHVGEESMRKVFEEDWKEMFKRISPKKVLIHGDIQDYMQGYDCELVTIEKNFMRKWRK